MTEKNDVSTPQPAAAEMIAPPVVVELTPPVPPVTTVATPSPAPVEPGPAEGVAQKSNPSQVNPIRAPQFKGVVSKFDPLRVTHGSAKPHLAELSSGAIVVIDGAMARVLLPTATEVERAVFLNQFNIRHIPSDEMAAEKGRWESEWRALLEVIDGKRV